MRSGSFSRRGLAVAALLHALALPAATAEAPSEPSSRPVRGPLDTRDLFPIRAAFLQARMGTAAVLEESRWQIIATAGVANTAAQSSPVQRAIFDQFTDRRPMDVQFLRGLAAEGPIHYLDSEDRSLELQLRRGLGGGWEVGLSLSLLNGGSGSLDGLSESFHSIFGYDQNGRDKTEKDRFLLYLAGPRGEFVRKEPPSSGLSDLALEVKKELGQRGPWRLALDLGLKLPTGDEERLMSSGSADGRVELLAGRPLGAWWIHTGIGILHLGDWPQLATPEQSLLTGFAAFERRNGNGSSTLLQLLAFDSPFSVLRINELAERSYQASVGFHWPLGGSRWVTASVTENLAHFQADADLAAHLGITFRAR